MVAREVVQMAPMMIARMVPAMGVTMVNTTAVLMDIETVDKSADMMDDMMAISKGFRKAAYAAAVMAAMTAQTMVQ